MAERWVLEVSLSSQEALVSFKRVEGCGGVV